MGVLSERLRKYFIMGSQDCDRDPEQILRKAIEAGITAFQYREKGPGALTGEGKVELGKRLRQICKEKDILFIVNDDVELAKTLQADGIHVGQEDMPVDEVRERFPDKIVGLSVANMEEVKRSRLDLVDYVGAGPIFATPTKPDDQPSGYDWLKEIRTLHPNVSIVAIGGIKPENAQTVLKAGADGLAVVTAITKAENIDKVVAQL